MPKTEKVLISIYPEVKEKAQLASKKIFGRVNLSGYLSYLITKEDQTKQS